MKNIFLIFTLLFFLVGCDDTAKTTEIVFDTPKTTKATVSIVVDKKILTIGIDNESELSFTCDTSVNNYKWYANDVLFSEDEYASFETPSQEKTYTITLTVEDDEGRELTASTQIEVKATDIPTPDYDPSFSTIRKLISNAHSNDLTYICFGDSTRSVSQYNNHYVFENVKNALSSYGVSAINMSVTGLYAKQAAGGLADEGIPSIEDWSDVVAVISGTGESTILNISSIGLNDYDEFTNAEIKSDIKKVITLIREQKPNTHFILTVASRTYYDQINMSNALISIYRELSQELNIPYINVPQEAMPMNQMTIDWYLAGDQTHLSIAGQKRVSDLILSKILP